MSEIGSDMTSKRTSSGSGFLPSQTSVIKQEDHANVAHGTNPPPDEQSDTIGALIERCRRYKSIAR